MKKFFLILTIFTVFLSEFFCATARYSDDTFSIEVSYNEIITPGDAVFVRMQVATPKNHKKAKSDMDKKATLQLLNEKKVLETAPFYSISKKKNASNLVMLCGVPVSPWLSEGNFTLKVIYNFNINDQDMEFSLPVTFKNRHFDSEDIELDSKNTDIKTDNSPERIAQIEKLNNVLFTSMPGDIYNLKKMSSPTTSTRYTAHYGDRRKYIYTNGKSSTSLHYGNDYGIPEGTSVYSCGEGRVVMAENRISTGWSIVIEHLPGLYSLYYHLSSMDVSEGDYVKQGELIGKSGSTGLATGPHLHWEMRLNGGAVRPEFFLSDFTFDE